VEVFTPSLKIEKRGKSGGPFYPEPENTKAKKVQWAFFTLSLEIGE